MRTNLNIIARISIACLLIHICLGCSCFVLVRANQNPSIDTLANKDEGYLILQSAFAKESELCYLAETTIERQGKHMPLVRIEYVAHLNGAIYRRVEYRRQNEGSSPIGITMITNQYGNWNYTEEYIIKDCIDYMANDLFNLKIFNNLKPNPGEFRVLDKDKVDDGYILVERIISNNDSLMKIRRLIQIYSNATLTQLSDAGIRSESDMDSHDIVPMRAVYKISKKTGIIIEDAYFNKSGERLASTRQFDKVTILQNIPMSAFELPKGLPFYFPNNTADNWKINISL